MKYKDVINKIFTAEINLYGFNYQLIGLVTQPSVNHFIVYCKNLNQNYKYSIDDWFKYDDLDGAFKLIRNENLSFINIRNTEAISLIIYKKT